MESDWLWRSVIATFCFLPIMILQGFFSRNYGVRPEAIIIWYSIGQVVAAPLILTHFKIMEWQSLSLSKPLLIILALGLTFGVASNVLFFQALSSAPNTSFPMAISNSSTIFVFLISIWLAAKWPKLFDVTKFDLWHLVGIVLAITGISIIALRK